MAFYGNLLLVGASFLPPSDLKPPETIKKDADRMQCVNDDPMISKTTNY